MTGYVIRGIYKGYDGLEESDILDDTVYLVRDKAAEVVAEYKEKYPDNYVDYVIGEVKIV